MYGGRFWAQSQGSGCVTGHVLQQLPDRNLVAVMTVSRSSKHLRSDYISPGIHNTSNPAILAKYVPNLLAQCSRSQDIRTLHHDKFHNGKMSKTCMQVSESGETICFCTPGQGLWFMPLWGFFCFGNLFAAHISTQNAPMFSVLRVWERNDT